MSINLDLGDGWDCASQSNARSLPTWDFTRCQPSPFNLGTDRPVGSSVESMVIDN